MTAFDYWIFGLRVRSMMELPELIPAMGGANPDVQIDFGSVEEPAGSKPGLSEADGALVLVVPGVARYRIQDGRSITVDADADVPERNLRLFLLGSAFGALLHQRGLLPLHANAIEIDGKAVAFMGASGEGKSTLAAWFHDRGHRVIADDVCVVRLTAEGKAYAAPGQQRLRLWKEALEASGRDSASYDRSFAGREDIEKFDVPLESARRRPDDCELAGVYVLETADRFSIEQLSGLQAAEALFSHTYRGRYINDARSQRQHWQSAMTLVQYIPIFRIDRPRGLELLDEHGRLILDHVAAALGADP